MVGFANLRRTTHPDGRLNMADWQPRDSSEFQSLVIDIAARVAHELVLYVGGLGTTPEQATEIGRAVGPLRFLLPQVPTDVADAITTAVLDEVARRWDGTGVP